MSRPYQDTDRAGGFDYQLAERPDFGRQVFRGPAPDLDRPYIAFFGAAQTFGRFVQTPFPALLGARLGVGALNLGVGGAGPRHFDRPAYLKLANGAEAVVLQALSGRSASSSLFDNSAAGGLIGATSLSEKPLRAEDFLERAAKTLTAREFARVIEEMRADYVATFLALIGKISAPRILLWLSTRTPDYAEDYTNAPDGVLGAFPQLVNARMVAEIAARCDAYVECVSTEGLPQPLWRSDHDAPGARSRRGLLFNHYYPSPQMHARAADLLEAPCRAFAGRRAAESARRFVVIGAERTGTNLLIGLLNQYEGLYCGNELFNPGQIAKDRIAWTELGDRREALLALRKEDPVGFLDELRARSPAPTTGFKLLYSHGLRLPALLDSLVADKDLRVIHVRRRNLLRRLVSERQARAASRWAASPGVEAPALPKVEITLPELLSDFQQIEARQAEYAARFADHATLEILYEDLAADPARVAARAAAFLGLPPRAEKPAVTFQKTGAESLADALGKADELRAQMRRWAAFFDD